MKKHRIFTIFALIVILCFCFLIYVLYFNDTSSSIREFPVNNSIKTILYWNKFFGEPNFYLGEGYIAHNCPRYNNCFATHNRHLQSVDRFDLVVFHGINGELIDTDFPVTRRWRQHYAFVALESPINRYIHNKYDGLFNLTMTYQHDSDVIWTYADVVNKVDGRLLMPSSSKLEWRYDIEYKNDKKNDDDTQDGRMIQLITKKRKLAVWYSSNCQTASTREKYVAELEKHMPVDSYGTCFRLLSCPKYKDCFRTEVEPNYFFYLSFENSLCDDYVTEKFFNALQHYVVPVVYGGVNYSRIAPPKSYINALDFDTPKELADYLIKLSQNATEYQQYFNWKKRYHIVKPKQRVICNLCEILNRNLERTYTISKWYSKDRCPLQLKLDKQRSNGDVEYATKKTFSISLD